MELNLNIAICDDNETDIQKLINMLESYHIATDTTFHIDTFLNGAELLEKYKQPDDYHIIFLDIEMPGMSGLKVAEKIRSTVTKHVIIVFISCHSIYMQDSFEVHPFSYLMKPFSDNDIHKLMNRIIKEFKESHITYSMLSTESGLVAVNIQDVLYIQVANSKNNLLDFYFHDKEIRCKGSLKYWTKELEPYNFYQCYRSILVNLAHIYRIDNYMLILDNATTIPIGRANKQELQKRYVNRLIELLDR